MPLTDHRILDLGRLEALCRFRLTPRGPAEGTYAGTYASRYRGSSVEFSDYREYVPGDDIRLMDWKAFARSERYYIRLFESERNLLSYAVMDVSASMGYTGAEQDTPSKLMQACRLAAALGYLTVNGGDAFGLSLASDRVHEHLAPARSWARFDQLLGKLDRAEARGATDLAAALTAIYTRVKRRGMLLLFSDFLEEGRGLWGAVDLFRKSHFDVVLFHVVHPEELMLPDIAAGRFTDPEGPAPAFRAEPEVVRELYVKRVRQFISGVERNARARGCEWHLLRTDDDPYQFLKRFLLSH